MPRLLADGLEMPDYQFFQWKPAHNTADGMMPALLEPFVITVPEIITQPIYIQLPPEVVYVPGPVNITINPPVQQNVDCQPVYITTQPPAPAPAVELPWGIEHVKDVFPNLNYLEQSGGIVVSWDPNQRFGTTEILDAWDALYTYLQVNGFNYLQLTFRPSQVYLMTSPTLNKTALVVIGFAQNSFMTNSPYCVAVGFIDGLVNISSPVSAVL